ncbi:MAG TPA: YIP1 family protein [Acidimicrobiia bacterium]
MLQNMIKAARLDTGFYNTVEHDSSYTGQAAGVVVVVAVLASIGTWLGPGDQQLISLAAGTVVGSLVGWVIWAAITFFVGTRFFGGTADIPEMLRVLGFAQSPAALAVVPLIGGLVGGIWALIAAVVAVREGLDLSTGKAIGTVIVGWIVLVVIMLIVAAIV